MPSRIEQFFSTNYMAPHGFCFLWNPLILWVHVIANFLIALSYFSIPLALWHFAARRPDMPFRTLLLLFATFIILCGLTHVFDIAVLWWPAYGIEGLVMLATGVASAVTALMVWQLMPLALTMPSPQQMQEINHQLNLSYAEIEQKVEARTNELEQLNHELAQAREKADAANEAKSNFLATMSHEIRTPMNVVSGIAHLLSRQELSEKQHGLVNTLKTSADTLLALINDLLDIEKIECPTTKLERQPFSVMAVVQAVMEIMQLRAAEKKLAFSVQTDGSYIEKRQFIGDAMRLQQVLLNLCSNAIKFTEIGSVTVTMRCEEMPKQNMEMVHIIVTDTGIGIAPEMCEQIFEKFVQADSSIVRKYGGTGLGLAITRSLVTLMGGTINLESELGKGSKFTVSLPLPVAAKLV